MQTAALKYILDKSKLEAKEKQQASMEIAILRNMINAIVWVVHIASYNKTRHIIQVGNFQKNRSCLTEIYANIK